MLRFEISAGPDVGRQFPVPDWGYVTIGRWCDATVFLHSPTIAKHHVFGFARKDYIRFHKMHRGFLTLVNGQAPSLPFFLYAGATLQVGEFVLSLIEMEGDKISNRE